MSWQPTGVQPEGWQPEGWQPEEEVAQAPVFSGTIANISRLYDTGIHSYALGAYFSGAASYAIAPAVQTGWSFNVSTGELTIDTDEADTFGPFTVTATNDEGSSDSNAFTVRVYQGTRVPVPGRVYVLRVQ